MEDNKELLKLLNNQSLIYVCFRMGEIKDRSLESVAKYLKNLYDTDPIYSGYINAITILSTEQNFETKPSK